MALKWTKNLKSFEIIQINLDIYYMLLWTKNLKSFEIKNNIEKQVIIKDELKTWKVLKFCCIDKLANGFLNELKTWKVLKSKSEYYI